MTNQLFISVIVPVYNGSRFLHPCLDALFASDYELFEVIVVDDGSTDDSAEIAQSKGAIVMPSARRQSGPAAARNLAAEKVCGDILLFVDADVVVQQDTLSKVAARFEKHPEIAALFGSYDDAPAEKNFLSQYKNLQHHFVHQQASTEAGTFWSGLGAMRRDVFLSMKGFDCETFQIPSIEDIELGVRLRTAGHRILLAKEIQAKHLKKWTAKSLVMTDVFCRAVPWSKLILTKQGMVNDLNLKTADRLSAMLLALSLALIPLVFWQPLILFAVAALLLVILFLNWKIFRFYAEKRGVLFAALTFPWLLLYFFYSGVVFVYSWVRYALPQILGFEKREEIPQTQSLNS